jgi:uncharacterized protein with HEPN domain
LRRLLVIGEAAARLTPESCAEFPEIPFPRIVGMRNRVVHDYGHVDLEIIWEIVQIHLPPCSRSFGASLARAANLRRNRYNWPFAPRNSCRGGVR